MDTKEIRLPYSEYKEMLDIIEKQKEIISKIEKEEGNIVIDKRDCFRNNNFSEIICRIPIIYSKDEAKDMLKEEFKSLYDQVKEIRRNIETIKREENMHKPKKKWWQ